MTDIYFKAFERNLQCRGFQFAEGETYEIEGSTILCERGFHFCKDLVLTLEYYPADTITDNKYAIVEPLGEVLFDEPTKHKGVTNKIRIVRVLTDVEVIKMIDKNNNSGDGNSGDGNSGDRNSGDRNSGDGNSGYGNSGDRNSGYWNSGDRNSGGWNSGNGNSGNGNSGGWNSCNNESGFFNSSQPDQIRAFNKYCTISDWDNAIKPPFLSFEIKDGDYKKSFQAAFSNATAKEIDQLKLLPNFDADVFFEISGIRL